MAHNKNLRVAFLFTLIALVLIFIAFISPYWLVFDGKLKNPKFLNLGKFKILCFTSWYFFHQFAQLMNHNI